MIREHGPVRLRLLILALLLLATGPLALPRQARANPVVPGNYPDPTVIRSGGEYWASATAGEWAPVFPLLRSRDLVHWRLVGSMFQRRPKWADSAFWAPELVRVGGRLRAYYSAHRKGGGDCIAVARAPRPQGPWSDEGPILCPPRGAIDAFVTRDESGRPFLLWKEEGNAFAFGSTIHASPLSPDGLRVVGASTPLLSSDRPWEGSVVEGPAVVRRGGEVFLLYAGNGCCGPGCAYEQGVARADRLLGPYRKRERRLLRDGAGWRCPGHGTAVRDLSGRDVFVYHAYKAQSGLLAGRELLTDRIGWGRDGWPRVGRGVPGAERAGGARVRASVVSESWRSRRLDPGWGWPQAFALGGRVDPRAGGRLRLTSRHGVSAPDGAVVARRSSSTRWTATVRVRRPSSRSARAGIGAFRIARYGVDAFGVAAGRKTIIVWRRQNARVETLGEVPTPPGRRVELKLSLSDALLRFAVRRSGRWSRVGPPQSAAPLGIVRIGPTAGGGTVAIESTRIVFGR